jgi:bud site selection protein 31
MSRFIRKPPPPGFEVIEPTLDALEAELRERVNEPHEGKRRTESVWPVHQINWQRSRYVYDMYYQYHAISKPVYDYCIANKLVDAPLIAKWKKPGYEKLCSTYAINPKNFKFGTVSICRVPRTALPPGQQDVEEPTTGCRGCASGKGGHKNIFGNKYGQRLAAIQMARMEKEERQRQEQDSKAIDEQGAGESEGEDKKEEDEEEDKGEEDLLKASRAKVWANPNDQEAETGLDELLDASNEDGEDEVLAGKQPNANKRQRAY